VYQQQQQHSFLSQARRIDIFLACGESQATCTYVWFYIVINEVRDIHYRNCLIACAILICRAELLFFFSIQVGIQAISSSQHFLSPRRVDDAFVPGSRRLPAYRDTRRTRLDVLSAARLYSVRH